MKEDEAVKKEAKDVVVRLGRKERGEAERKGKAMMESKMEKLK